MGEARRAAQFRRSVAALATVSALGSLASCGRSRPVTSSSTSAATSRTTTVAATTSPSTTTTTTTTVAPPPTTTVPTTPAIVVRHGDETHRWIALTFDAGSDAGNTAAILDLLAARHIHATFSLTGAWTRANPELARRIAREGHTIVNHTNTHQSFTGFSTGTRPLTSAERFAQLAEAEVSIITITGVSPRPWFRPPYGDYDASTPTDAARAGYHDVLLWTVDSLGWKGLAPSAVAARCLDGAAPGGILLLHVGSASTDAAALPSIIDGLAARGYTMVAVGTPGFITG